MTTPGNAITYGDKYLCVRDETATASNESNRALVNPMVFERVFEETFPSIHRFIARRVGTALADDLASETFAIAFRRRATFDARRGSPRSWLFGIAMNLIRTHWRTEQHLLYLDARLRVQAARREDPMLFDDRLSASLAVSHVANALGSLSREQREVILLHAWAELSHDEIAVALDIAPGTVRSRLSRARAAMADQLGGFDFDLWLFDEVPPPSAQQRTDHD